VAVVFTFPSQSRQGTFTSPIRTVPNTFNALTGFVKIALTIATADAANPSNSLTFRIERADGTLLAGATWNGGPLAGTTPTIRLSAKDLANQDVQATLSIPNAITIGGTVEIT
jgi:hypothetical protein